jgi:prolipoprotein diacylglyceryl transferase
VTIVDLALLPSPSSGELHLGPFPLRAYALFIIIGVFLAIWIGDRRWVERGGRSGTVSEVATLAVPFGIVGGRLYHVITSPHAYVHDPVKALEIWKGGLGIWGAVALGALGAWLVTRRRGIRFAAFADAIAPGIAVAQGIGRIGNYFNQELFGRPTSLPWGLKIDPDNEAAVPGATAYHPTFLYELLWDLGVAGFVIWADRRWKLGRGRAFALYVASYCLGRLWIESLRIDDAEHFLGLRLNIFTSIVVGGLAVAYIVVRRGPREDPATVEPVPADADDEPEPLVAAEVGGTGSVAGARTSGPSEGVPDPAGASSTPAPERAATERAADEGQPPAAE